MPKTNHGPYDVGPYQRIVGYNFGGPDLLIHFDDTTNYNPKDWSKNDIGTEITHPVRGALVGGSKFGTGCYDAGWDTIEDYINGPRSHWWENMFEFDTQGFATERGPFTFDFWVHPSDPVPWVYTYPDHNESSGVYFPNFEIQLVWVASGGYVSDITLNWYYGPKAFTAVSGGWTDEAWNLPWPNPGDYTYSYSEENSSYFFGNMFGTIHTSGTGNSIIPIGEWSHIALVRDEDSMLKLYVNGQYVNGLFFDADHVLGGTAYFSGWAIKLDEVHAKKSATWLENFTPPSRAYKPPQ